MIVPHGGYPSLIFRSRNLVETDVQRPSIEADLPTPMPAFHGSSLVTDPLVILHNDSSNAEYYCKRKRRGK